MSSTIEGKEKSVNQWKITIKKLKEETKSVSLNRFGESFKMFTDKKITKMVQTPQTVTNPGFSKREQSVP